MVQCDLLASYVLDHERSRPIRRESGSVIEEFFENERNETGLTILINSPFLTGKCCKLVKNHQRS